MNVRPNVRMFRDAGMELFAQKLVKTDPDVVASSYGVQRYWPYTFDSLVRVSVQLGWLPSRVVDFVPPLLWFLAGFLAVSP